MKPVKISRKSDTNDTISAVSAAEMDAIMDYALDIVTESVNRILAGEATPIPLQDGQASPCTWCDHPDACKYDSTIPGCRIKEVDHKHRVLITQLQ